MRNLKYYVVPGVYFQNTFTGRNVPTLLDGKTVRLSGFKADGTGRLKVNDASVVVNDVFTVNGVVHVLDR